MHQLQKSGMARFSVGYLRGGSDDPGSELCESRQSRPLLVQSDQVPPHRAGADEHQGCDRSRPTRWSQRSADGSFGRPRARSPMILRWIWLVPEKIVPARLEINVVCQRLSG